MSTNVPVRTAADRLSYDDLYARWERGNWQATEIGFSEDVRQWRELSDFEREAALWNYALFFWGEDAVADGLSPYIDAAPRARSRSTSSPPSRSTRPGTPSSSAASCTRWPASAVAAPASASRPSSRA
jgi:hypothetical protein